MKKKDKIITFLGVQRNCGSIALSPYDFANGHTFYGLDVAGDLCNTYHNHLVKSGNISIEIGFETALSVPYQLVVYAVYPNVLLVSKDRTTRLEHII